MVGAGFSARHHRTGVVSGSFFGDGATGQGILYESMTGSPMLVDGGMSVRLI